MQSRKEALRAHRPRGEAILDFGSGGTTTRIEYVWTWRECTSHDGHPARLRTARACGASHRGGPLRSGVFVARGRLPRAVDAHAISTRHILTAPHLHDLRAHRGHLCVAIGGAAGAMAAGLARPRPRAFLG